MRGELSKKARARKGRRAIERLSRSREIIYPMITAGIAVAVFCIRRGWERPFFALTDALFIGGFVALLFALLPRVSRADCFDGFAYALSQSFAGLFPWRVRSYSAFKSERSAKREAQGEGDRRWITPLVFFVAGLIFSLFFL